MVTDRTPEELRHRGLRLEWATNGWNMMEVVVTISLGVQAGSLDLLLVYNIIDGFPIAWFPATIAGARGRRRRMAKLSPT